MCFHRTGAEMNTEHRVWNVLFVNICSEQMKRDTGKNNPNAGKHKYYSCCWSAGARICRGVSKAFMRDICSDVTHPQKCNYFNQPFFKQVIHVNAQ